MNRFLVRRALRGLLVIWLITLVLFGMFFVAPSNVAQTLGGRQATPQTIALINQRLGLDRPLWEQYLSFLGNALRGDLGYDYYKQIPVTSIINDALPKTASIAFGAAIIWMLIGVTNGVLSAVRPRSFLDRGLTALSLFFFSMPTFLLGLLLLYYLYFQLTLAGIRIFPAGGYVDLTASPGGWLQHMILPWITVALVSAAAYTRLTRTSMLEVLALAHPQQKVHLIYGVTRDLDLVQVEAIDVYTAKLPSFSYDTVVADADSTHPRKGWVTQHIAAEALNDGDVDVYLCGPPPMVDAVRKYFDDNGVKPNSFHYEKFTPNAAPRTT